MIMDIGEIRRQYKYAKDRKKCISILADLNDCSTGRILKIVHTERENQEEQPKPAEWNPTPKQKAIMDRLDELDAMIKPLEDEYKRTAAELMKIGGADIGKLREKRREGERKSEGGSYGQQIMRRFLRKE